MNNSRGTGIIRRIDDLGRIIIPKEFRKIYDLREGDPLEIYTHENGIEFRKIENFENHEKFTITRNGYTVEFLYSWKEVEDFIYNNIDKNLTSEKIIDEVLKDGKSKLIVYRYSTCYTETFLIEKG